MMHAKSLKSSWCIEAGGKVECTCLSKDGRHIAIGTDKGALVLEKETGLQAGSIPSHSGIVSGLAFGKQGRLIVGSGGSVRLYSLESQAVLDELHMSQETPADLNHTVKLCLHPDGDLLGAMCESGRSEFPTIPVPDFHPH